MLEIGFSHVSRECTDAIYILLFLYGLNSRILSWLLSFWFRRHDLRKGMTSC